LIAYVTTIDPPNCAIDATDGKDIDDNFDNDNNDHNNPDDDDAHNVPSVGTCNDQDDADHDPHDNLNQMGTDVDFHYPDEHSQEDEFNSDIILYNDADATHHITEDIIIQDHGFFTTNAGDSVRDLIHHHCMDQVSGHVLLNQAAVCM
jgi:hypothetical protein